mmetsp:Transcript_9339/g.14742  ORF Transcript_9339/g.14742 Transcript_9339/m.14742 type:complete len:83 (+) Transcript_9339:505-753(+)
MMMVLVNEEGVKSKEKEENSAPGITSTPATIAWVDSSRISTRPVASRLGGRLAAKKEIMNVVCVARSLKVCSILLPTPCNTR